MKRRFNYFMAMAATLAIGFTSCSDDPDPDPAPAQDIAKEYTGTELTVTNGGETIADGTMKIDAVDNTNATITLTSIVNGQPTFEVPAAVIQSTTGYAFEGKKDIDGMKVAVKGTVVDGKASVDVAVEISSQEILNSWTYYCETDTWGNETFNPLIFEIETHSGNMYYYDTQDSLSVEDGLFIVPMLGSMLPRFFSDLQFVFSKDGYVSIKVVNAMGATPANVDLPKIARYYYNPTKKELVFDAPLGGLLSKSTGSLPLGGTMQVAFLCKFEEGKLEATLSQDLLNMLLPLIPAGENLDPILQMIDPFMPADLQPLLPWLKNNIKSIAGVLTDKKNLKSFTLGGRLMPMVQEDK